MRMDRQPRYPVFAKRPSRTWWLRAGPYRRFAVREATAVFAGAFSVLMLLLLFALSRGRPAYEGYLRWLQLPAVVALSGVILVAAVYHTATWFRLTSHILVVRLGRHVVPRGVVTSGLVLIWLAVSAAVAYFTIWFAR